jgi:hypothetical protein
LEARGFAGGGGGGEGFGAGGVGGEGRRKEAEEATGLKSLGLGVGEEAVGSERNCIRMVVSDFRIAREDDATCCACVLLGQRWMEDDGVEDKARRRDFSSLVGRLPHFCLVRYESPLNWAGFHLGPANQAAGSNKQPILKFTSFFFLNHTKGLRISMLRYRGTV